MFYMWHELLLHVLLHVIVCSVTGAVCCSAALSACWLGIAQVHSLWPTASCFLGANRHPLPDRARLWHNHTASMLDSASKAPCAGHLLWIMPPCQHSSRYPGLQLLNVGERGMNGCRQHAVRSCGLSVPIGSWHQVGIVVCCYSCLLSVQCIGCYFCTSHGPQP